MKRLIINGRWNDIKRKIQNSYPDIRDTDLKCDEDCEDEVLYRLIKITGKEREEDFDEHNLPSVLSV